MCAPLGIQRVVANVQMMQIWHLWDVACIANQDLDDGQILKIQYMRLVACTGPAQQSHNPSQEYHAQRPDPKETSLIFASSAISQDEPYILSAEPSCVRFPDGLQAIRCRTVLPKSPTYVSMHACIQSFIRKHSLQESLHTHVFSYLSSVSNCSLS